MAEFLGFIVFVQVVASILCLILFFKVWGMTNDVSRIKYILQDIADNMASNKNVGKQAGAPIYLEEGDTVLNTETGDKLIVVQVFPDGDVSCKPAKGLGLRKVVKIDCLKKIEEEESL